MVRALRTRAIVGPAGRVSIDHSDLPEGSPAEVIVLIDDTSGASKSSRPLASYLGALEGQFGSSDEVETYLSRLRDEWDRQ